jgi:hypothetical protein
MNKKAKVDTSNVDPEAVRSLVLEAHSDGPLKRCIYAGIVDKLEKYKDLVSWDYRDKDDLFCEVIQYLWTEGAANILATPATASMETRLRKLAEKHTMNYTKSLVQKRKKLTKKKHLIGCGAILSDYELRLMKRQERRELEHKGRQFVAYA